MRRFLKTLFFCSMVGSSASAADLIQLPDVQKQGGLPLMEALNNRKTTRSFADKEIDQQTLGHLLWAAYGVSHDDGRRTIPTALNQKDLALYVSKADGVWLYDADKNALQKVSDQDIRPMFETQDYMKNVPVVLIYAGSKDDYASMHAGSAYQNVSLYTASNKMGDVVRGYFDKEKIAQALHLPEGQRVIVSQAVGWPE